MNPNDILDAKPGDVLRSIADFAALLPDVGPAFVQKLKDAVEEGSRAGADLLGGYTMREVLTHAPLRATGSRYEAVSAEVMAEARGGQPAGYVAPVGPTQPKPPPAHDDEG